MTATPWGEDILRPWLPSGDPREPLSQESLSGERLSGAMAPPMIIEKTAAPSSVSTHRPGRSIPWVSLAIAGISVALIIMIGCLAFFRFVVDGRLAIRRDNGRVAIHTGPSASPGSATEGSAEPADLTVRPRRPTPEPAADSRDRRSLADQLDRLAMKNAGPEAIEAPDLQKSIDPVRAPALETMTSDSPSVAADRNPRGSEAIRQAYEVLRSGSLDRFDSAVAAATADADQRRQAEGLQQFAGLVDYYRGAVDRSLEAAQVGSTFDLTSTLRVSLVEVSEQRVVIKFNGRNHRYPRERLPLALTDRLAADSLRDAGVTAIAAAACFQAVAPVAGTPAHRHQAMDRLRQIDQPIIGADRDLLMQVVRDLIDGP